RASLARRRGDLAAARELSHAALAGLPAEAHLLRSIAARNLCAGYLYSGDTFAAEEALAEAWIQQELLEARIPRQADRRTRSRDARAIRLALQLEGTSLRLMQGWLHEAAALYRELIASASAAHDHARAAIACGGLGQILREWNDLTAARELFEQSLGHAAKIEAPATARNSLINLALTQHALDRPAEAWATMERAVELARSMAHPGALIWATSWQTRLALLQGRRDDARRWALGYRRHQHAFPEANLYDIEDLTMARALLGADGSPAAIDEADAILAAMLPRAEAAGRAPIVIEILLLQALSCEARQPGARWGAPAQAPLRRALDLAAPEGYVRLFADLGPPMLALLRTASRRGSAPQEAIRRILAAAERKHTLGGEPDPEEPEALSPREREVLQLLAAGRSNQEIAELLTVSLNTVKSHLKNIYAKLGAGSRTRALAIAHGRRLIPG
ncbi:MAG TPA: LuxR C-terminal-related transcriptional regulator, partial [Herpetosiphonaceae bacterium]